MTTYKLRHYQLRHDSKALNAIEEVEKLMDKHGLVIHGQSLTISKAGQAYYIGGESDTFPRFIDEPIWRY